MVHKCNEVNPENGGSHLTLPLSMALTPSAVLPPGLVTSHLEYVRRVLNLEDTSVGYNIL